jgi:hypothetical protein
MTPAQDHFEGFEPHTLLKHRILRSYLQRWGRILLHGYSRLRFVDACAGRGEDEAGNPGSPLIALSEAAAAAEHLSRDRGSRVQIEVVAIEKNRRNALALDAAVSRVIANDVPARVVHGTLEDALPEFEGSFAEVPTLFFVDPFGMEPLRADLIRRALRGKSNEVLLLFASQASLRHVGATEAGVRAMSPEPDLFSGLVINDDHDLPMSETDLYRQQGGARSAEILDQALGTTAWRGVLAVPRHRRLEWLLDLYEHVLRSFGATHVLKIPILDPSRQLKYHLVHASKHPRAFGVMKDAAEAAWGKGEKGGSAVRWMRQRACFSTSQASA